MEVNIKTLEDTKEEASRLLSTLHPNKNNATLITLSGELGAGKTAFVKAVALLLGVKEVVSSPTFVLEKIYNLPDKAPFTRLVHIDAYRLSSAEDISALGFSELINDPDNLILLEWPEKIGSALYNSTHNMHIKENKDGTRTFSYD